MTFAGKLLTCCAAGAMLAACGGKDDGNGTPAPAGRDITYDGSTTALLISQSNVAAMASLANESVSGSVGSAAGAASNAGAVSVDRRIGWRTALAQIQSARRDFAVAFVGAYLSDTRPCGGGGSVSMTASTASDVVSTVGDYFEVSYLACSDGYGTTANGTMKIEITATDGANPSDATDLGPTVLTSGQTYGMRLTVTDFSFESTGGWFGMEADMTFSEVWNASTFRFDQLIQGTQFVMAEGVGSTTSTASLIAPLSGHTQFSMEAVEEYTDATATNLYAGESAMNAKVCSTAMNGCINIETSQPIRQLVSDLYPDSGSMKVSDDLGHYIQIVPTDGATGAVTVSWDVTDGVPPPDGTCYTYWSTMSTDACFP